MTQTADLSPRMQAILDAAIRVVARSGLRGLTHRAVDAEAGLPQGSTSGYLRTRLALLTALSARLSARLASSVEDLADALAGGVPQDEVVERAIELFAGWLKEPDDLMAKSELWLESVREPAIAEIFSPFRTRVTGLVEQMLGQVGAPDAHGRAVAVMAAIEGVLSSALAISAGEREQYVRETSRTIIDAFREPRRA